MKIITRICFIISICFFTIMIDNIVIASNKKLSTKIKSGSYDPTALLRRQNMRFLPIPSSNENYAMYQSIGKKTSIVLGKFKNSENEIFLIQDTNSDGKVDEVYIYDAYKRQIKKKKYEISDEEFLKLKEGIIYGNNADIGSLREGVNYVKALIKSNSELIYTKKYKRGFQVTEYDPDETSLIRTKFVFSKEVFGVNFAMQINYHNVRETRVQPIIPTLVYANKSKDEYIAKIVDELSKYTVEHIIVE